MKKQITYLIIALLATIAGSSGATPDKAAMEGKEKAAWQAFKDKNEAEFKKVVDKDFRGVFERFNRAIDSTFVGRPYAWPAISRVVDFASPGLILNEKRCGGAAMAERSNWTTP